MLTEQGLLYFALFFGFWLFFEGWYGLEEEIRKARNRKKR